MRTKIPPSYELRPGLVVVYQKNRPGLPPVKLKIISTEGQFIPCEGVNTGIKANWNKAALLSDFLPEGE